MLLNSASYLDPRFHRLVHLTRDQQQELREKVKKELIAIAEQKEGHGGNEAADCQYQDKTALSAMGDLFGDIYSQSTNTTCDRALRDVIQRERDPSSHPQRPTGMVENGTSEISSQSSAGPPLFEHPWDLGKSRNRFLHSWDCSG